MAITVTKVNILANPDTTERGVLILLSLALSGNYGGAATHGDTISFAGISEIASSQQPTWAMVMENPVAGTAPSFYAGIYADGTTRDNGVIAFGLNGTEYTQGSAYSGALAAATFQLLACFPCFC